MKNKLKRCVLLLLAICLLAQPALAGTDSDGTEWCSCRCRYDWYFVDRPTLTEALAKENPDRLHITQYPELYLQMYHLFNDAFGEMIRHAEEYSELERYYAVWTWFHGVAEVSSTVWHEETPSFARPLVYKYGSEHGYSLAMYTLLRALQLYAPTNGRGDPIYGFVTIDGQDYHTLPAQRGTELFLLSDADWPYNSSIYDYLPCTAPSIAPEDVNPSTEQRGSYTFLRGTNILVGWDSSSGETDLVIPEGTAMIAAGVFEGETGIRSVTFPEGLSDIGYHAFRGCTGLESVSFPDTLTCIGEKSFAETGIKEVTIPASVVYGTSAFDHSAVENVTFAPGSLRVFPRMFEGCTSLTTAELPLSLTHVGSRAFAGCGLVSIALPKISVLQEGLFSLCDKLETVVLQEGLLTIENAFRGCSSLKEVTIPSTVFSLDPGTFVEYIHGDGTFSLCSEHLLLRCGEESAAYYHAVTCGIPHTVDDALSSDYRLIVQEGLLGRGTEFRIDHTSHVAYLAASHNDTLVLEEDGTFVLPDLIRYGSRYYPVTEIREKALYGLEINKIRLPRMLKVIDEYAFESCRLTELDLSDCSFLREISPHAFEFCQSLASVTLGDFVTSIGESAFMFCDSLTEFRSGAALETIGDNCFAQSGLHTVWLGKSVKYLGAGAFVNMTGDPSNGRTAIYFEGNAPALGGDGVGSQSVMLLRRPGAEGFDGEDYAGHSTGIYVDDGTVALMDYAKVYDPDENGRRYAYIEAFHQETTEEYRAYVAFYDEDHRLTSSTVSYLHRANAYVKGFIQTKRMTIPENSVRMTVFLVKYSDGSNIPVTCSMTYDITEAMAQG